MENKKKNGELQSRREFFKKAAKGALPILGAIVLATSPAIVKAAEETPMGCRGMSCVGSCSGSCTGGCFQGCMSSCRGNCTSCSGSCTGTCDGSCRGTCTGGCTNGCYGVSY